jgi:hypothetical protein
MARVVNAVITTAMWRITSATTSARAASSRCA